MTNQDQIDYQRIEKAIHFIKLNFKEQPSLEDVARAIHVSPYHFQRLFSQWAGVSPKKFMQYLSLEHAKAILKNRDVTLLDTAYATGLSGSSRLHDLFISIEGMTPGEYKSGGVGLDINYSFASSPFGNIIIGSTSKGVCYIHFDDDEARALHGLQHKFPQATYHKVDDKYQQEGLAIFQKDWQHPNQPSQIKLHLAGTPFQLKVWEGLLKIPLGKLNTYGDIAQHIGKPKAARAVGTAIGSNPIAFLIPCHRVIQGSGNLGGYMWGETRKSAIIGWEAVQCEV